MVQEILQPALEPEGASALEVLIHNIPTFLNTFLIIWGVRTSRKNARRLAKVETKVVNGESMPGTRDVR